MQGLFYNLFSKSFRSILFRNICLSRCSYETHYDVLKLPRNCTAKEIRASFIKLSKEYHPDKNVDDPDRHKKFVKLNEAYTVLSRPASRREYDLSLVPGGRGAQPIHRYSYTQNPRSKFHDLYENRDKSKDEENREKPYYGIKGIEKMSNAWILGFILVFTTLGVSLQIYLIRESTAFSRKILDQRSIKNAEICTKVRQQAMEGTDEDVYKRLRKDQEDRKRQED